MFSQINDKLMMHGWYCNFLLIRIWKSTWYVPCLVLLLNPWVFFFHCMTCPYPWTSWWAISFLEKFYGTIWPALLYFFYFLFLLSTLQSKLQIMSGLAFILPRSFHSSCKASSASTSELALQATSLMSFTLMSVS